MYEDFIKNQVFVGMSFSDTKKDIQKVIEDSCAENNLNAKIVNNGTGSNILINEIQDLIEQSEFIIIDISLENPNVYYELGYADGVGNEGQDILILTDNIEKLNFNIRHRRVHEYKDAYHLQNKLKDLLPQFIKEGRTNV